jgi:uncharacterized protein
MVARDNNAADFLKNAGDLLYANEATNSLLLGLSEDLVTRPSLLSDEAPWYLRVVDAQGKTLTAALRTPPVNLILTFASEAQVNIIAEYIFKLNPNLPGVTGPLAQVEDFSRIWFELTGKRAELGLASKIYQADSIQVPHEVPGYFRAFRMDEYDLALRWMKEFGKEAAPNEARTEEVWRKSVDRALGKQMAYVWINNEEPVAMAHLNRPTQNTITVSYVYTPKHQRCQGFASALTAKLSEKMLKEKRYCVLYTDLANPTSNKIYQKIGYREVTESKYVLFK